MGIFTRAYLQDALLRGLYTAAAVLIPFAATGVYQRHATVVALTAAAAGGIAVIWRAVVDPITSGKVLGGDSLEERLLRTYLQTIGGEVVSQLASSSPFDLASWRTFLAAGLAPLATLLLAAGRGLAPHASILSRGDQLPAPAHDGTPGLPDAPYVAPSVATATAEQPPSEG